MVYIFLANGFEEVEAIAPIDMLRRAEYEVKIVGVGGNEITGSHGITIKTDLTENEVETEEIEGVILPGGMPGTLNLESSPIVKAVINYCRDNNKLIAAICAAPSILGHMGLLKNKKAVCFPGFEQELFNAELIEDQGVVCDGNIITAKGAGVAIEFGLEIVKYLTDEKLSNKIKKAIQKK